MSGKWNNGGVDTKPLQDLMKQLKDLHDVVAAQREGEIDKVISLGENVEMLVDYNQISKEAAEKVREASKKLRQAKANLRDG